jgi:hypothetical protein
MNLAPLRKAVNKVLANPNCYDQTYWHVHNACGTTHCIGGHIQIDAGKREDNDTVREDVKEILGCTWLEVNWLTDADREFHEIYELAKTGELPSVKPWQELPPLPED